MPSRPMACLDAAVPGGIWMDLTPPMQCVQGVDAAALGGLRRPLDFVQSISGTDRLSKVARLTNL
jgi:hypothetical protein